MTDITLNPEDMEALEELVDRYDLAGVVNGLFHVCHEKAEHLRSNWQDEQAAKVWEQDAAKLAKLEAKLSN